MARYVQFANATKLNQLLDNLYPLLTIDPATFLLTYFDIRTCGTNGLDNWGRILNFPRVIQVNDATDGVFGFGKPNYYPLPTPTAYPQNFNNGRFYNPDYEGDTTNPYILNDFQYRIVLLFRYRTITSNMSMYSINHILNQLVISLDSDYKVLAVQTGTMEITYKFNFPLQAWQRAIFKNRNLLPVPAGVNAIIAENQII